MFCNTVIFKSLSSLLEYSCNEFLLKYHYRLYANTYALTYTAGMLVRLERHAENSRSSLYWRNVLATYARR